MDTANAILTIPEIADYLRVSRTTVWRWCNEGKLPAFKVGKVWRIRRADMERITGQNLGTIFQEEVENHTEKGNAMAQTINDLLVSVEKTSDAGEEARGELARQLLVELGELEAVTAQLASPTAASIGAIAVKIAKTDGISSLISILSSWLSRDEQRILSLQLGHNKLEVSGVSDATQTALIEWFQLQTGLRIEA